MYSDIFVFSRARRNQLRKSHLVLILATLLLVCKVAHGARTYYYLHVASFRSVKNATQYSENLKSLHVHSVIRGELVPGRGYWCRVYAGPFNSVREAEFYAKKIRERGISDYTAIRKSESLIISNLRKRPSVEHEKKRPSKEMEGKKKLPQKRAIHKEHPEKAPLAKEPAESIPLEGRLIVKEGPVTVEKTVGVPAAEKSREVRRAAAQKFANRGRGRNIGKGRVALSVKHTYREIETEVTSRKRITPTITEDVVLGEDEKDDFPTSMHMDALRVRFGLTDYLELFVDGGAAYDEISDLELTYGGGVRLNLYEVKNGRFRGIYTAIQGEYLAGEFEEDYTSSAGNNWAKETEWQEFTGRLEFGIARSRFAAYLGGTYFFYDEDTERRQKDGSQTLQDELEEENRFGAYGGAAIYLTPNLVVNVEGRLFDQDSVFGALEYRF